MDRARDVRIARGLGWTNIAPSKQAKRNYPPRYHFEGNEPGFAGKRFVPVYSDPSQTGPLLEALLEKGWQVSKINIKDGIVNISAIRFDRKTFERHWEYAGGLTLAEAVAEMADKVLGVSDE